MRNRRLTVIIATAVALLGAPRAWQEFGDLWASVQHTTQAKFLGLALNSQVKDQSEVDAATAPQAEYLALNNQSIAPAPYAAATIERQSATAGRMKAETTDIDTQDFEPELAHDQVSGEELDSLTHSRATATFNAQATVNCLAAKEATPAPPAAAATPLYLSKDEAVGIMAMQQVDQQIPTFVFEKGADIPAKVKKALEDAKVLRQKARFIVIRNAPLPSPPPAS